ncbi:MAG: SpoIIE family protein phosphatase [Bacteroidia bacterium]
MFPVFFEASSGKAQTALDTSFINKELKQIDKLLESNVDSAGEKIKRCKTNCLKNNYFVGLTKALLQLARYYTLKGKTDSSLVYLPQAIAEVQKTKDTTLLINSYLFYARNLATASKYETAISQVLIAQKYAENQRNFKLKIKVFHDLGYIYSAMNLHSKAIQYFSKGLYISKINKDTFNFANISARLGGEFNYIKLYDSSLFYNLQGLSYFKKLNHKRGIGASMVNLASTYTALHLYDKATEITKQAIKLRTELGDNYAVTMLKVNLTDCYYAKQDYNQALELAKECENLVKTQNESELILQNFNSLKKIYRKLNNNERSYFYSEKYIDYKDSIFEATNFKTLNELQVKYEAEKNEREIKLLQVENQNKEQQANTERKSRNIIIVAVSLVALLIGFFTLLLLNRFRIIKKQNNIIARQKHIVEEKHKEITDSITYAKHLQQAILPPQEYINQYLPHNFVLYKPKDIVAGDFYWMEVIGNLIFIAAADSTGHGVPGAMVSVVCSNALNRTVKEFKETQTGKILDKTRELVIETFEKSQSEVKDGMDISLLCIDNSLKKIFWSGANNPLWYIQSNELKVITANKQTIGKTDNPHPFTTHEIPYQENTLFYLFTDGFADQFGGPKGKKFKYKQFLDILLNNHNLPLAQQASLLNQTFNDWKGVFEQVDDMCVIGVKI